MAMSLAYVCHGMIYYNSTKPQTNPDVNVWAKNSHNNRMYLKVICYVNNYKLIKSDTNNLYGFSL